MSMKKEVVIRQVWADNLQAEFDLIRQIIPHYPFAAMDTEFPGVIFHPNVDKRLYPRLHPVHNYQLMKVNVEALNIIQLGLVLSDADGICPILEAIELPSDIGTFMRMVRFYFGWRVYDVKYMARFCNGLYGGLEKVANTLKVERVAGKSHQAGSDSLLTLQTFIKMTNIFFTGKIKQLNMYKGVLHGLEVMY
ncbi:hypothetical protein AAG906_037990 [Vitis piasezkii]